MTYCSVLMCLNSIAELELRSHSRKALLNLLTLEVGPCPYLIRDAEVEHFHESPEHPGALNQACSV